MGDDWFHFLHSWKVFINASLSNFGISLFIFVLIGIETAFERRLWDFVKFSVQRLCLVTLFRWDHEPAKCHVYASGKIFVPIPFWIRFFLHSKAKILFGTKNINASAVSYESFGIALGFINSRSLMFSQSKSLFFLCNSIINQSRTNKN